MRTRRIAGYRAEVWLVAVLLVVAPSAQLPAQSECPRGTLPAYAHNDYLNEHPLFDALALGYKGAEADVFLVKGKLQLGHERRAAVKDGTLEALYLAPLRALVARCGMLTADGQPFLLTLEIKEKSRPTFDTLVAVLSRYPDLLSPNSRRMAAFGQVTAPVQVVLVGWYPVGFACDLALPLSRQSGLQHVDGPPADAANRAVGLIGLDYEMTLGRRWQTPAHRRRWLAAVRATKAAFPLRRIRAYHVPVNEGIYRKLLAAGVDLIGSSNLVETARVLRGIAGATQ